jgi:hypothetical protein
MPDLTRSAARRLFAEFAQGEPGGGPAFGERKDPATITAYAALAGASATVLNATGVIGGSKGSASPPPLAPPPVMPEPDDAATKAAKRRALAGQAQRQGRQSTILSNDLSSGDLLGS